MHRVVLTLLVLLLLPQQASAQRQLDVKGWLGQPNVRLVAVEFYANWCESCMRAMPRWGG